MADGRVRSELVDDESECAACRGIKDAHVAVIELERAFLAPVGPSSKEWDSSFQLKMGALRGWLPKRDVDAIRQMLVEYLVRSPFP